jgi:flavorubredoxin
MAPRTIKPGIYSVGAIDWDRRLFDSLIPLPLGTSYNAYLVQGESKTALIDTVEPALARDLFANLDELGVKKIDYLVCHHAEQDHSGSIPAVLARFPGIKVVTNQKCMDLLATHLRVGAQDCDVITDGAVLDLGGRSLQFMFAPWVHWPETMFSFLREDRVLFTCDFFGSHFATGTLYADDEHHVYLSAKRYYAEIMMPFGSQVLKNVEKVTQYPISFIAPSHGPVYDDPAFIIEAYRDWAGGEPQNIVCLPYVTMHDSTRLMVDHLTAALTNRGVAVERFDLTTLDAGELASSLVHAGTIVLGTPTVLAGPHPLAAYAAILANALKPRTKHATVIGSYGWAGKTVEMLAGMMPKLKVEFLEPVLAKGMPREGDYAALDALADAIAERHRGLAPRNFADFTVCATDR